MDEFARRTEQIERQFALLAAAPAPVPGDAQRGVAPSVGAPAAAAVSEDPDAPTDVQKLNYRIMHLLRTCDAKDAQLQVRIVHCLSARV